MARSIPCSSSLLSALYLHTSIHVSLHVRCYISEYISHNRSPESPRWLVNQGLFEEARLSVAQTNSHGNVSDPIAVAVFKEIVDTLKWEKENGPSMSPLEMFKSPMARKRLLIGMSPGPFSCIAGNIIASYYFGSELDTAGITDTNDQLKAVSPLFMAFYVKHSC
jgi:hypothetical protein